MEPEIFEVPYLEQLYTDPSTLTVAKDAVPTTLLVTHYSNERCEQTIPSTLAELSNLLESDSITWVDVRGLGNPEILQKLAAIASLHPLELAEIVNVPQRAQCDDYPNHLLLVLHVAVQLNGKFHSQQVSLILGKNYAITFQENPEFDCFQSVRDRLRYARGNLRQQGADYLVFSLIDAAIDSYFPVLDEYSDRLEKLELATTSHPQRETLAQIYFVKRELLGMRRLLWPQREALNSLIRSRPHVISDEVRPYLRDTYDHIVQAIETVEIYRELASGLVNLYLSALSHRMNAVVKLLTIISTVFIPLTFIAGVYGMNFDPDSSPLNMPELRWVYGYPAALGLMFVVGSITLAAFWRMGWLGAEPVGVGIDSSQATASQAGGDRMAKERGKTKSQSL